MLKLPKTYQASGDILKVRREKAESSYFDVNDETLVVEKSCKTDFQIVSDFLHEALEASLTNLGHRYTNWKHNKVFALSHDEFHDVVGELARGVLDLIDANRKK